MFGRIGNTYLIGLPGNPVSALVCAIIFLAPALKTLMGIHDVLPRSESAYLGTDLEANDEREDYLRASLKQNSDGSLTAKPFDRQDSSMFATIARSDALIIRAPFAPAAKAGDTINIIPLEGSIFSI